MSDSLKAVVFDWAGTMVDYGSRAPASVFMQVFANRDVPITMQQAREPMGKAKRDHIMAVLAMSDVAERWQRTHSAPPSDADVDALYEAFLPLQKEVLKQHSDVIPGAVDTVKACRDRGLKIGGTTGYTRELMEFVEHAAAEQGYRPDVSLAADEVDGGRPAPWLLFEFAKRADVYPMSTVVKVDDTPVGILAGRNAGTWTVGVTKSGNEVGLSLEEVNKLDPGELKTRLANANAVFEDAGAHFVIETVADLPNVLDKIQIRLSAGEKP